MRMTDIIIKKKQGEVLTEKEIHWMIEKYTQGDIPDYQMSALAMAICFRGMTSVEIAALTDAMFHSGETIDLTSIIGIKADKHSTGGVGDKTSLVLGPLVASCGVKVAKMSGRGLGHTGGTLDKLEAIPNMSIALSKEQFLRQVNEVGISIIGQTGDLVPADKKLYALRDVTGTVESIPLIASSIMSKKLASGSDTILLDVKFGSGAFMKTIDDARLLASTMVEIGKHLHRDTRAMLTDMSQPLGLAVGNIDEVKEAIDTLKGHGPEDFVTLCLEAASIMLVQAKKVKTKEEGLALAKQKLASGAAYQTFLAFIQAQGGDCSYIEHPEKFAVASIQEDVMAEKEGYIHEITALHIGEVAMHLGAGRATKEDRIDMTAGILLKKKVGDYVKKGDILCRIHTNLQNYQDHLPFLRSAFVLGKEAPKKQPIIHEIIE